MAIAVIGGLISSTVLSLILVPVVYTFVDSIERWFGSWVGNLTTKPTEDDRKLMKKHNQGGASLPAPPITPAE
jgi:HAE1 family hydrophobic/amphiphilic exporter-1